NGFIRVVRMRFESFGFEALEPKAKAVALPIQNFHPITRAIQKNKKHGDEHRHFDIQLDQGGEAVDGLSEVDRMADGLLKESGAQHRPSAIRLECGVHGADTL